jgi:hypothetical protein
MSSWRRITGNLAQINAHWRVNNAGWLSEVDYFPLTNANSH